MMARLLAALLAASLLSACAGNDELRVSSRPIELDVARTADPAQVRMLPVGFRVLTRDNLDEFVAEMSRSTGDSPVFIVMTARDYENMVLNLADLRRYIEQQQAVIAYYRRMTVRD